MPSGLDTYPLTQPPSRMFANSMPKNFAMQRGFFFALPAQGIQTNAALTSQYLFPISRGSSFEKLDGVFLRAYNKPQSFTPPQAVFAVDVLHVMCLH